MRHPSPQTAMPPTAADPAALQAPLTNADFDVLGEMLAADWAPETTMDLEQLDGFLAGLICAPRVVLPSAYLPVIFGDENPAFPDGETAQRFLTLLMRRNNQIASALNVPVERLDDPRAYVPFLIDWDESREVARQMVEAGEIPRVPRYGELWARGFLHAVHLTQGDWESAEEDEAGAELVNEALDAIIALVPEDDEDAEVVDAEGAPDARDEMVADALIAAYDLRDHWRDVQFEQVRVKEPIRRAAKVGRNDPCPCGSGKKFKLCHGREH
jgi:uncharacterized protein